MPSRSRTPLAWLSLVHHPGRFAVSVAGIALAVTLMFMQLGFRNAMFDGPVALIDRLNAELVLISPRRELLSGSETFPRRRLAQAAGVGGVRSADPLYFESARSLWKNPRDATTRAIRVLAYDPAHRLLDLPETEGDIPPLRLPGQVLFDERSRADYGEPTVGARTELADRQVEVVGTFRLGTDFATSGNVIMSARDLAAYFPEGPRRPDGSPGSPADASRLSRVDVGVIRLAPSADAERVRSQLRRALPPDVLVLTKREFAGRERRYWQENTAIGYVFALGTAVGFLVGSVICYQILYNSVLDELPQLATLKAIGYTDGHLVRIVLARGLFLAGLGFLPALAATYGLYAAVSAMTSLPMRLTPGRAAVVLALTAAMCMSSAALAVRKAIEADPADVF